MRCGVISLLVYALMIRVITAYAQQSPGQALPLCSTNKKAIELYVAADNYRVRGQFQEGLRLIDAALQKDPKFCEAWYRKAQILRGQHNKAQAVTVLEAGLKVADLPAKKKIFHFDMAEILLSMGRYREANEQLDQFLMLEKSNPQRHEQALRYKANCSFALANMADVKVQPVSLGDTVNSFATQYFPALSADERQLFYTRRKGLNPQDTEDIMRSVRNPDGRWGIPTSISPLINTRENEGTCAVSADGRQLIFTSCGRPDGLGSCDLYESRKVGERWSVPVNLGATVNAWSWESQPSLSSDGRVLYFVSDRKGGLGGRDIYRSEKDATGKWQAAVNMGPAVNTKYDEISPFIHVNGVTLFFASNGRPGFGGYDIYQSIFSDNSWQQPVNFGYPLNNHEDQFAMFITADGSRAYYALEDEFGRGQLMMLVIPPALRLATTSRSVQGRIRDSASKSFLGAKVELIELSTGLAKNVTTSDSINGQYLIVVNDGSDYGLFVSRPGYLYKSVHVDPRALQSGAVEMDIELEPLKAGSHVVLNNIFFDFDRSDLRPESIPELEEVVRFLTENPRLRIEISGHTDNTGQDARNRQLSLSRARSVMTFLQSKGIAAERMQSVGNGSSQPRSSNATEQGRALNRRIEFRILP